MATLDDIPNASPSGTDKTALDVTPDHVFDAGAGSVVVPVGDALLQSEYSRHGHDLQLETPDGVTFQPMMRQLSKPGVHQSVQPSRPASKP